MLKQIKDHNSIVHKLLTYGVGIILVIVCIVISNNCGGEVSPKFGWLIIAFLFYYALLSGRILETLIFGTLFPEITTMVYGYGKAELDPYKEVKSSGLF